MNPKLAKAIRLSLSLAVPFSILLCLLVILDLPWPVILAEQAPLAQPVRGMVGDLWADVIVGQPDFNQITPNEVTGTRLFNPGGVLVDRSVKPNRLYVYDGGNSRVLGLNHLGTVSAGPNAGAPCTTNSDYPGYLCAIQEGRAADLVIGQPSLTRSACNGDGNFANYPQRAAAAAATLCSMPVDQVSPLEGGSFANMAVDPQGNLYVPDWYNHRVLRYNSPFETDTVADHVWGQADFAGNACNRGRDIGLPDAQSLCLWSPFNQGFVGGVGIDSIGNLWVTDNQNNRVLRFPKDPQTGVPTQTADLVLGQPNFVSWAQGSALNQMWAPAAVRVDLTGTVFIADSLNSRVLVFEPPLSSGMSASRLLGSGFRQPTGMEFDGQGGLWVSDRINNQVLLFVNGSVKKVLFKDVPNYAGECGGSYAGDGPQFVDPATSQSIDSTNICDSAGSIGIDDDGNVIVAGSSFVQDVWRFPAPFPDPLTGTAHSADARLFKPYQFATQNRIGPAGLFSARGVAAAAGQLIVADAGRLLFWNSPLAVANGQSADGYVGTPNPYVEFQPHFGRIREDKTPRLWAIRGDMILAYALPLSTGAAPILTITPPIPILGGGSLAWDDALSIGGIAPVGSGEQVWIADPRRNRVFRINHAPRSPSVDIVLGQTVPSGTACNQGRGVNSPSRDSLCEPGAVALDRHGNLFVSDHALEVTGNHRLLEFNSNLFPGAPGSAVAGIQASRVYGTNGSFTGASCQDPLCGPFEPAFSSDGHMVVGLNSYIGSRFPLVYQNPLTATQPYTSLKDFDSMPYAAAFDADDNLYVASLNRDRVLIYRKPFVVPGAAQALTGVALSGPATGVISHTYTFTASASPPTVTQPITYSWRATGQTTVMHSAGLSDVIAFVWSSAGPQVISITASNAAGSVTSTQRITLYLPVRAAFNASPLSGTAPMSVVFTNSSTGPFSTSLWDFGDSAISSLPNPSHLYTVAGTYTVILNVSGPGGMDLAVKPNFIVVRDKNQLYLPLMAK